LVIAPKSNTITFYGVMVNCGYVYIPFASVLTNVFSVINFITIKTIKV
jgi:hypothetical protein